MELGIFGVDTLLEMKLDAIDIASGSHDATTERRLAAHEAIVAIDRELDRRTDWALEVRRLLVTYGGES